MIFHYQKHTVLNYFGDPLPSLLLLVLEILQQAYPTRQRFNKSLQQPAPLLSILKSFDPAWHLTSFFLDPVFILLHLVNIRNPLQPILHPVNTGDFFLEQTTVLYLVNIGNLFLQQPTPLVNIGEFFFKQTVLYQINVYGFTIACYSHYQAFLHQYFMGFCSSLYSSSAELGILPPINSFIVSILWDTLEQPTPLWQNRDTFPYQLLTSQY